MRARALPAVILFVLSSIASSSFAQQLPSSSEVIDVSIINVDVFVTDKKGNRIHGLTADDFEIRENGKPQPISNFAEYAPDAKRDHGTVSVQTPDAIAQEGVSVAPPAKRTIVLFIDLVPQPSARVREVFGALRELVNRSVRPGDAATVVAFDGRLVTRQAFTDDHTALNAALAKLEKQSIGLVRDPADAYREAIASDEAMAMYVSASGRGQAANTVNLERNSAQMFDLIDMGHKAAAITSIMESMSGTEGKKIMVLALHRFGLNTGVDGFAQGISQLSLDFRVERLRQSVMSTANANGVTLYPIHPMGLLWRNPPHVQESRPNVMRVSAEQDLMRAASDNLALTNQTASLQQIAKETGGLMAFGPSDIVDLLPRVADDLESYYSLAYRAEMTGMDARRKIVVTTKNKDYEVRSRRAVVEKSDDTQMDDRVVANLFQPVEHNVLPVELEVGAPLPNGKNRWLVPVTVRVPVKAFMSTANEAGSRESFSVFVATGGDFGVISDVAHKTKEFTVSTAQLDNAAQSHFTYTATLEIDRYARGVSVGVRDDVSRDYGLARAAIPGRIGAKEKRGGSGD